MMKTYKHGPFLNTQTKTFKKKQNTHNERKAAL